MSGAPREYRLTIKQQKTYRDQFWRIPRRLGLDGKFRELWLNHKAATSVLAVLALHAIYRAEFGAWTRWRYLSLRQIAFLAGIDKGTVGLVMRVLASLGYIDTELRPNTHNPKARQLWYRVAASCYPGPKEQYVEFSGRVLYYGWWRVMPSCAYRHMFLVLGTLDVVRSERAYLSGMKKRAHGKEAPLHALKGYWLTVKRREHARSLRDLERRSGLSRTMVRNTLRGLTNPEFEDHSGRVLHIVKSGRAGHQLRWYAWGAATRRNGWFELAVLNDLARVKDERARIRNCKRAA